MPTKGAGSFLLTVMNHYIRMAQFMDGHLWFLCLVPSSIIVSNNIKIKITNQ